MEEINNKAMAERIALEQEYRYGVSSPVLVELQMMKNALGDVHILDENQQSINAAFGVELAKLQQTLPKDFVPPLTQYVNDTLNQEIATTATQSRNDGLNSGSLNAPQTIEEMERTLRIAKCLQGEPVCVINDRQAPHGQGHSALRKWAKNEVFSHWNYKVISPELGEIVVDENSARDTFAHGLSPFKIEAVRAIKDVIEQGVVFTQTKIEDNDHYFIAAPVTIENQVDIVSVLVRKDMNTQRMYLHSVMVREKILEKNFEQKNTPEHTFPKADSRELSEQNRKLYSRDTGRILQNYLKVNIQQLEVEIREKILEKNFEQNKTLGYSSSVAETLKNEPEPQGKLYPIDTGRILQNFLKVNISQLEQELKTMENQQETVSGSLNDITRQKYEQRIDELFSGSPAHYSGVHIMEHSDLMDLLDYGDFFIQLNERKVNLNIANHPEMTAEQWKKLPDWLDNPAAVLFSRTVDDRLVFVPDETINNAPVFVIVEPEHKGLNIHLVVNAYARDRNPQGQFENILNDIENGNCVYVDMKRARNLLDRSQLQLLGLPSTNANHDKILTENDLEIYRNNRQTDLNSSQSPLDEPKNFAKNSDNINQDTQNTPDKSTSNIDNKQKATEDLVNISDYKTFQEKVLFAAVPETEISKMIDEIAKSRTYLAVDFDHKDQAKAAGAKYDPQLKGWYAEEITPEIRPFLPQQPEILTEARKPYSDLMAQAQKIGVDLNSQNFKEEFDKWVRVPLMGKGVKNTDGGYKLFRNDDGTIGACVRNHSTNDTSHWNDRLKDGKQIQGKVPLPDYLANQKQKEWNTIAKHTATKQVAALRGEVAEKAYHQLENAKPDDPYIQKKGIENVGKLKRLDDGSTVVPLYHNGKIANLQMIPAYDSSQKRLMTQAEKMGSYYAIGNGKNPSMVIVAEGMATADSVHQIATKLYGKDNVLTLSAIDSGNLANVAAKVQQNFPTAQKVIAADNDAANEQKSGKNAGLQAAIMVTHDYKDFQVAICPILADDKGNFKNTDWNDYLKAQGKEQAVRAFPESLNGHTAQKTAVKSLEQMTPQQNKTQGGMEL